MVAPGGRAPCPAATVHERRSHGLGASPGEPRGLQGFAVFLACLTLGVAAIAAVGLTNAA